MPRPSGGGRRCGIATEAPQRGDDRLVLEDGSIFRGRPFGGPGPVSGEVIFNTGMVGYPEALTDPSYRGQILVLTYPLIGNYGVAARNGNQDDAPFESDRIQIAGLIVSEVSETHDHWNSSRSLDQWLREHEVPGLSGVDTRALTKRLRVNGSMLGKILTGSGGDLEFYDPNRDELVPRVSIREPVVYPGGAKRIVVIDCGAKENIIRSLRARGVTVIRVPWDYDFLGERFDGVLISNGPGNPRMCGVTIATIQRAMEKNVPIFGLCLGHQLLALAAGGDTYKLKFGHHSQNQPCIEEGTGRCYITSQNHGYAVNVQSLPAGWQPWFVNANDRTNEGIRHSIRPFASVQFHPEAAPGPVDTNHIFDWLVGSL